MRIGLWGFYGYDNFGDDLLLSLIIQKLKEKGIHEDEIIIFSQKEVVKNTHYTWKKRSVKNILQASLNNDLLIVGPGGLFPHKNAIKIFLFAVASIILRMRNKKLALIGLGIGNENFNSFSCCIALKLLFCSAFPIVLRNRIPRGTSRWVLGNTHIYESHDYLLSAQDMFRSQKAPDSHTLAIFLANIFPEDAGHLKEKFIDDIVKWIYELIDCEYSITLIGLSAEKDTELHKQIAYKINNVKCESINYNGENKDEIIQCVWNAEAVIAMRFHALVMAVQHGKPVYSIAYSDKTEDLCISMGIGHYCQRVCFSEKEYYGNIIELDLSEAMERFEELMQNKDRVVSILQTRLHQIQKEIDGVYEKALREALFF